MSNLFSENVIPLVSDVISFRGGQELHDQPAFLVITKRSFQGHQLMAQNALKHSKSAEKRKPSTQDDGKGEILEAILGRILLFSSADELKGETVNESMRRP